MTAATRKARLTSERKYSEKPEPFAKAEKLRVIQLGSYPATNRGARTNLLTIHDRLQATGHESTVIDLTRHHHVKQPGVRYPRSIFELARLLLDTPADIIHLHIGGRLTLPRVALAAIVNKLPESKRICTLHLGGQFRPKKGLRAMRWGVTRVVLRQFDSLIAINPEIASFFDRIGVGASRMHLITPFPCIGVRQSVTQSDEIESFCRQHTPLIASVGEFEPGFDLPKHFDILSKVRERYPSTGLIAIGNGSLRSKYMYARALHQDCNHIEFAGSLSEIAIRDLIRRANVLLCSRNNRGNLLAPDEALRAYTPGTNLSPQRDIATAASQVIRSLQIARPRSEDATTALTDGVDDVIRLYQRLAKGEVSAPLPAVGYEWPSMG